MGASNLLVFPEAFDNAAWVRAAIGAVNANIANDPVQGQLIADKLVEDATTAVHSITQTVVRGAVQKQQTFSVYILFAERTTCAIQLGDGTGAARVAFNLSAGGSVSGSGVVGSGVTLDGSGIQNITNGWRRCWVTATLPAATTNSLVSIYPNTDSSYAGDGVSGIYLADAILENAAGPSGYLDGGYSSMILGLGLGL